MPRIGDQHAINNVGQLTNPFEDEKPHVSEYTAQQIATLSSRLEKQLGPEYISSRQGPGGKPVYYLAAEKSITLANEVFGFNGWCSSIREIQMDFVDVVGDKVSCGLHAIVRVTLRDGTYHEDVGYGHMENAKGKAQAFEKAKKEATTDALKRALRSFGNLLGNCVYDKDYLQRVTKVKAQPAKWDVENLHRHSDFAPIKKELDLDSSTGKERLPSRAQGVHEDEFGSDDFDEVDFAVPEGQDLDTLDITAAAKATHFQRRNSATSARHESANRSDPREPLGPRRSTQRPNVMAAVTKPPPANHPRHSGNHHNAQTAGTNMQSTARITPANAVPTSDFPITGSTGPAVRQPAHVHHSQTLNSAGLPPPGPSNEAQEPAAGFYTARAAEMVQNDRNIALPIFNPHLESPSIRKTAGVDHTTTRPINREAVCAQVRQPLAGPGSQSSGTPNTGPGSNTSFQVPAARKLGMPGAGMASPLQNRGSYKPPQMVKRSAADVVGRTALEDVTNAGFVNHGAGEADAKRSRVSGPGSENVANIVIT